MRVANQRTMANTSRLARTFMALVSSASCVAACGGSATENGVATAGASSAGSSSTGSAGSGGASNGSAGAGGRASGGTSSGGTSSGGTSSGGASSGGASNGGTSASCEQAKDGYTALLASLLAQSSSKSCELNTDCEYVQTSDCGNDCSVSIANSTAGPAI